MSTSDPAIINIISLIIFTAPINCVKGELRAMEFRDNAWEYSYCIEALL